MKILLHDYAGHPFQAELSRKLTARGHEVIHAFFAGDTGPKGRMSREDNDPASLSFLPIEPSKAYSKTNLLQRWAGDVAYGHRLADAIIDARPDVVISGNTPTEAQEPVPAACREVGAAFVYWCQDFYSIAADRLLRKRLPVAGHAVGAWYKHLDRRQMRAADHIILITEAFRRQIDAWNIPPSKISVIPNWGALDEIPLQDKDNAWAREQSLSDDPVCLYTGTLAMKHDPRLLAALAKEDFAEVVVVASGVGADQLAKTKSKTHDLGCLRLLPLQPFDRFAEVLATADVLLAVIERDAGEFSVPSKVLNYLCAGRPIVLSAPRDNLAAQIVTNFGAGRVVEPGDASGFVNAVRAYLEDEQARTAAGRAGRRYAESHFNLDQVADRFEAVIDSAMNARC